MAKKDEIEADINKMVIGIVALLMSFSLGYVVAKNTTSDATDSGIDTAEYHDNDSAHDAAPGEPAHAGKYLVAAENAPTVQVQVTEDAKSGWNVKLTTAKFKFTPENVNGENVVGEGHAHLYVDGEKVSRLYGPDYHYDVNFDGSKEFRVTLNANDHSEYTLDNEPVDATVTITHDTHE